MIHVFKNLPVSAMHFCTHSFSGCVYLHEQECWAYSGGDLLSKVLIPGIKYCPWCGKELKQEEAEYWACKENAP